MLDSKLYGGTWNQMQQQMRDVILFPSAHAQFAAKHIIHDEYSYDPTDDGPEVNIARAVLFGPLENAYAQFAIYLQYSRQ